MRAAGLRAAGVWSVGARVWASAVTLLIIPLASDRLPPADLGVFLLLSGLAAVITLAELGVPNAIVTPVAAAVQRGDLSTAQTYVAKATRTLGTAAAVVLAVGAGATAVVLVAFDGRPFPATMADATVASVLLTTTACVAASVVAGLPSRVLIATGHAAAAAQAGIAANGALLVAAIATWALDGPVAAFLAASLSSAIVTGAVSTVMIRRYQPALRIQRRPGPERPDGGPKLAARSAIFFGIGLAGFVGFETDAFVVAATLGTSRVPEFAVPGRMFLLVPALATVYFTPLWPAVAQAAHEGDRAGLRHTFSTARRQAALAAIVVSGVLAASVGPIMGALTPSVPRPSGGLVLALAAMAVVHTVSVPYAVLLSGLDLVGAQLRSALAMAAANIATSVVLAEAVGLAGPALATVACQTLLTLVPMTVLIRRRLAR